MLGSRRADTRIIRGGSFGSSPGDLVADFRFGIDPSAPGGGFRLARVRAPETWMLGVTALLALAGLRRVRA